MTSELITTLKEATSARFFLEMLGVEMFARNADEDDLSLDMLKTLTASELLVYFFSNLTFMIKFLSFANFT